MHARNEATVRQSEGCTLCCLMMLVVQWLIHDGHTLCKSTLSQIGLPALFYKGTTWLHTSGGRIYGACTQGIGAICHQLQTVSTMEEDDV